MDPDDWFKGRKYMASVPASDPLPLSERSASCVMGDRRYFGWVNRSDRDFFLTDIENARKEPNNDQA